MTTALVAQTRATEMPAAIDAAGFSADRPQAKPEAGAGRAPIGQRNEREGGVVMMSCPENRWRLVGPRIGTAPKRRRKVRDRINSAVSGTFRRAPALATTWRADQRGSVRP